MKTKEGIIVSNPSLSSGVEGYCGVIFRKKIYVIREIISNKFFGKIFFPWKLESRWRVGDIKHFTFFFFIGNC